MNIARDLLERYGYIPRFIVQRGTGSTRVLVERIEFFSWSPYGDAYGTMFFFDGSRHGKVNCGGCFQWELVSIAEGKCTSYIKYRTGSYETGYQYTLEKGLLV